MFEKLGMVVDKLGWGWIWVDRWKCVVELVLSFWESWCVFLVEIYEYFVNSFNNLLVLKKLVDVGGIE